MKLWTLLTATWLLWLSVMFGSSTWVVSSSRLNYCDHKLQYDVVVFRIKDANSDTYKKFMEDLRNILGSGSETHAIPLLRPTLNLQPPNRYVQIDLYDSNGRGIQLAMDVTNVYIVAYRVGDRSYFFRDAPAGAEDYLFSSTQQQSIGHGGSYTDLERAAGINREDLPLGLTELDHAISSLATNSDNSRVRARSLLVCIQMISEAARYKYIERRVHTSIVNYQNFRPDPMMLSFENNWGTLSTAVQQSNQGVFSSPVRLQRPDHRALTLYSISSEIIANLALMLFICNQPGLYRQFSPFAIRSVMQNDIEVCKIPEPKLRIIGVNGLCVDVRDGQYNDGNPIQLWTCQSVPQRNQLWRLKTDGTIQSNGKCLTTYNDAKPGNYVMIFDCNIAKDAAKKWRIRDNGDIVNPAYNLFLTARSSTTGVTLTVEKQNKTLGQAWRPTNRTNPFVTSIFGFMNACLQANGKNVQLQKCASAKAEQKWALYADGSIRPNQNKGNCLSSNEKTGEAVVQIVTCKSNLPAQRWLFTNDNTIKNYKTGLVLNGNIGSPVFVAPFVGGDHQTWIPLM